MASEEKLDMKHALYKIYGYMHNTNERIKAPNKSNKNKNNNKLTIPTKQTTIISYHIMTDKAKLDQKKNSFKYLTVTKFNVNRLFDDKIRQQIFQILENKTTSIIPSQETHSNPDIITKMRKAMEWNILLTLRPKT